MHAIWCATKFLLYLGEKIFMAKIKFYKLSGKIIEGKKIKSITGEDFKNDYKTRFQQASEIAKKAHIARVKSEEIILLTKEQETSHKDT